MNMKRIKIDKLKEIANKINLEIIGFEDGKGGTYVIVECPYNHTYLQRMDSFKVSKGCKYCNRQAKYSFEEVKNYVENLGYTLVSKEYKGMNYELDIICENGHLFNPTFHNLFHNNSGCPTCKGGVSFNYEYVKKYVESKSCELLSEYYINCKEPLKIKCSQGHTYNQSFENFKLSTNCEYCDNKTRKFSYNYVKGYIECYGYFLISEEYINKDALLDIKCDKGHEYKASFHNFKAGCRCPICNESKGEKSVKKILNKYSIEYILQYKFKDCKFKQMLPFDFYLPNYNILIEYDGIQHFEIIEFFGGLDGFIDTKIRDTIKNEYCKKNNIPLIRIPYWEKENIEQILIDKLKL